VKLAQPAFVGMAERTKKVEPTLSAALTVYNDFFSYSSGVYRHVSGEAAGGHCVCVVGYNDAGGYWICKNSWGDGWGDDGFFRIAYGECGIDSQFPFYDVDLTCPVPTPVTGCERYLVELRRILLAARTNAHLRSCLRYYVCHRGPIPIWCPAAYRRLAQQVALILRRCPRELLWFCRVLG